jgi:hypothetical protein
MKNTSKSLFIIMLTVVFLRGTQCFAQADQPLKTDVQKQPFIADLEKLIPELMRKANVPGLSLAVIRDGQLLWTGAFGIKSTKTNEPASEDTIFEAAMMNGDKELAINYYKKALEMIPKDTKTDKAFLETIKADALEKLKELEKE